MSDELREVREAAEAATPGPWTWWTSCSFNRLSSDATRKDGDVLHAVKYRDGVCGIEGSEADMRFIALANPQTILALLAERDDLAARLSAAERDVARLDRLASEYWDLRCFDMPTGQGDADVGWQVVEHVMGTPPERIVAEHFRDDARAALDTAIAATQEGSDAR